MSDPDVVMELRSVSKRFAGPRSTTVHAMSNVDLKLHRGRITALVGASGSGKSTVARVIARLTSPDSGQLLSQGEVVATRKRASRAYRRQVQLVFQDPFASLNPLHRVHYHLARPLAVHAITPSAERDAHIQRLLESVGLSPGADFAQRLPHELSGGQRQRVAIARALAVQPSVLLADEPTSMLDVSLRLGILKLLRRQCDERQLAVLLITHDLASARQIADEILVMQAGRIVESGPADIILQSPQEPYTRQLLAAAPDPDRTRQTISDAQEQPSSSSNV